MHTRLNILPKLSQFTIDHTNLIALSLRNCKAVVIDPRQFVIFIGLALLSDNATYQHFSFTSS